MCTSKTLDKDETNKARVANISTVASGLACMPHNHNSMSEREHYNYHFELAYSLNSVGGVASFTSKRKGVPNISMLSGK